MTDPKIDAPRSESASPELRARYAVDGMVPGEVVLPESVEEVSRIMASASSEGRSVLPFGGGVLAGLGNLPRELDMVLSTSGLAGVIYHEPADLVASVQAGATVAELRSVLSKGGQALPLDAPFPDRATIGGIIAAGFSGPSRLSFGEPRDWLIGIKVVGADGRVSKAGGRVVKNVTGYDLCKLYSGSLGTLGIIVEANFKLAPTPDDGATIVGSFGGPGDAFGVARSLLSFSYHPQALQLIDSSLSGFLGNEALPVGKVALLVRHSGRRSAVKRKMEDTSKVVKDGDGQWTEIRFGADEALWQNLIDLDWSTDAGPDMVLRASMLPSQVEGFWAAFHDGAHPGLRQGISADVGTGIVKLHYWSDADAGPGTEGPDSVMLETLREARQKARGLGATIVVQRCPPSVKEHIDIWGEGIEGLDIMRRIKYQMDPGHILSPGRFVGRL